jgi:hypothetical protein
VVFDCRQGHVVNRAQPDRKTPPPPEKNLSHPQKIVVASAQWEATVTAPLLRNSHWAG